VTRRYCFQKYSTYRAVVACNDRFTVSTNCTYRLAAMAIRHFRDTSSCVERWCSNSDSISASTRADKRYS